jgi:short-subunit dehydrogenase
MVGSYSATMHAIQAIAEAMQEELKEFGIQVQTINPGPFRNIFPKDTADWAVAADQQMWERTI